ncbi:MAG: DHHW family protein, partial [Oscillospiraceae bacterium]
YFSTGKSLGIEPLAIDKFDIEHASNDFKGTLYSKCLYDGITPDIIDLYSLSKGDNQFVLTDIDGKVINDSSVYFKENLTEKDKYLTYTGDNRGLTKIINKNLQDGIAKNKLLIFKDSYANAIIPFLVNHFDEISVVDLRYLNKSLEETINFDDYGKILFLYNTDSFATQKLFSKLFS